MNDATKDLFNRLCTHDWTYAYSDDQRVWERGHADLAAMVAAFKAAARADAEAAAQAYWQRYIHMHVRQLQQSFGDGSLGYYQWLRAYLPPTNNWRTA